MKILILYQYFGTPKGSWSTRIYELSRRWKEYGSEITIITAPYDKSDIQTNKLIDHQNIEGINVIIINFKDSNRDSKAKRVFKSICFAIFASYYSIITKADVVLASSGPITVAIPGIIKKYFSKIPLVFEMRDLWPEGIIEFGIVKNKHFIKILKKFELFIYDQSNLIVTASPGQSDFIKNKIHPKIPLTISNACDITIFKNRNQSNNIPNSIRYKPFFIHIGSMGLIHSCNEIVQAARWLKDQGHEDKLNICFIGEGADKSWLKAFCVEHDLNSVYFFDQLPKTELSSWLQLCTATLFTTVDNEVQKTSSPNKIFDSFAAGKGIIQNSSGWISGLINKHNCGINVEYQNPSSFGEALLMLSNDKNLAKYYGENAFKLAEGIYSRDYLAMKYYEAIKHLLDQPFNKKVL
jgi:glycosyltransferase involved in cell wall biosynthesis